MVIFATIALGNPNKTLIGYSVWCNYRPPPFFKEKKYILIEKKSNNQRSKKKEITLIPPCRDKHC